MKKIAEDGLWQLRAERLNHGGRRPAWRGQWDAGGLLSEHETDYNMP